MNSPLRLSNVKFGMGRALAMHLSLWSEVWLSFRFQAISVTSFGLLGSGICGGNVFRKYSVVVCTFLRSESVF